jgi:hypothetical protein
MMIPSGLRFFVIPISSGFLRMTFKVKPTGGDRGIRTPNLRDANAALSQLSYIPVYTRVIIAHIFLVSQ